MLAYYEPFVTAVDSGVQDAEDAADNEIVAAHLPAAGLRVGVLRSIADRVRAASRGDIPGLAEAVKSALDQTARMPGFLDGTIVETAWDASMALHDWYE